MSSKLSEWIKLRSGSDIRANEELLTDEFAERIGYARMPWQYELECTWTPSGELLLQNGDDGGLLPTDQAVVLTQLTEQE